MFSGIWVLNVEIVFDMTLTAKVMNIVKIKLLYAA